MPLPAAALGARPQSRARPAGLALLAGCALWLMSQLAAAQGTAPAGPQASPPAASHGGGAPRGADGLLAVPPLARVTDLAGVLTPAQRAALDARLADFEAAHGSQLAVILVDSVQPEPIEDFAHRVGDTWKIGRRGIGDGVLLVAAIKDRRMRIDVALALEGAIPDVLASRIIRERIAPAFAAGDYAGGLNAGLDGLFALILGEDLPAGPGTAPAGRHDPADAPISQLFVGVMAFGLVVGSMLRRILGFLGALLAAGAAAALVYFLMSSALLAALGGVIVLVLSLVARTGGGGFLPLPMGGGGGGSFGGSGGGFSSGGGGNFSGGGASGSW